MKYTTPTFAISAALIGTTAAATDSFTTCKGHLFSAQQLQLNDLTLLAQSGDVNEISAHFRGRALESISTLNARFTVSVLGVKIDSQEFDICEGVQSLTCPIKKGDAFQGGVSYRLPENIPDAVDADVRVEFFSHCDAELLCVEDSFKILGTNSEFDESEVDFLYNKWFLQHSNDIQMPESSGNLLHAIDRKHVFKENLKKVSDHNEKSGETYKMALNQFAHLTHQEFKDIYASGFKHSSNVNRGASNINPFFRLMHGFSKPIFRTSRSLRAISEDDLPTEVNWVTAGGVTPVKNQGSCGSCWSFAATGALEGAYFVKYNKLVSFSEQELVSCDHEDLGCNGGSMDQAYEWVQKNGGLCSEEDYPYTAGEGVRGFCHKKNCTVVPNSAPKNFVDVDHSDLSLQEAVAQQPVAVAIEADEAAFQFYSSGVLTGKCDQQLDHGVLLVGYGEEDGVKYWLVKNSWGPMWGLEGYIKLVRGTDEELGGECGILLQPSYPEY